MSKRRVPTTHPAAPDGARAMRPWQALAITALVVALVIGAGVGLDWAASPHPTAAFTRCHTAARLAPSLYAGPPPTCIDPKATYDGTMATTKGDFSFVLLTSSTPKTVNNFVVLAENGYFNGLAFFRAEDWVAQAGDPLNSGRGGPGSALPPEPPGPKDRWVPGSMGMARFPDGTISGSQFFVLKQAWPGGDPSTTYNHFATITLGFDVVGQLTTSDRILSVEIKRS